MQNIFRYLLVGLLMTGMTVDTASANRWYHRMGCATPRQTLYLEICPPAPCCLPVECCHESVGVVEPSTASPTVSAEADTTVSPDPGPAPAESAAEDVVASPEKKDAPPLPEVSQPESSIVNQPAPVAEEAKISPPPVPTPQPSLDAAEVPAVNETTPEPDADSLFDPPAASAPEPMPAESLPDDSPLSDSPAADLFDEPITPETPTAETPVEETPTDEADPLDDLLPPSSDKTEPPANLTPEDPAPEEPAEKGSDEKEDSTLDDLFGQQPLEPILSEPGGLASHSTRVWTDDGARFHCEARLQQVTAKTVVLLKNNGKRIAVFFSRLSDSDLQFVRRQVVAQRELLAQRAAAEQLASR